MISENCSLNGSVAGRVENINVPNVIKMTEIIVTIVFIPRGSLIEVSVLLDPRIKPLRSFIGFENLIAGNFGKGSFGILATD